MCEDNLCTGKYNHFTFLERSNILTKLMEVTLLFYMTSPTPSTSKVIKQYIDAICLEELFYSHNNLYTLVTASCDGVLGIILYVCILISLDFSII
jgi:hypothetical protein